MFKICFFVPVDSAEVVKMAMFEAGAGKLGHYDQCSFETAGTGQFRPLPGSHPAIGSVGLLQRVAELKIEILVLPEFLDQTIEALKKYHPYEEPAFDVIKLVNN